MYHLEDEMLGYAIEMTLLEEQSQKGLISREIYYIKFAELKARKAALVQLRDRLTNSL